MKHLFLLVFLSALFPACANNSSGVTDIEPGQDDSSDASQLPDSVAVHPIYHGSIVLTYGDQTIFVDPYGGAERYASYGNPDLVLITHTHGDHLDPETLGGIDLTQATLVAPQTVMDALQDTSFAEMHTLANGENWSWEDIGITAVPAYNPPPKENFHPEGDFNGYVLDFGQERVYISGDTEGVPAMRDLENIDVAFVCMNLPYTMDIEQAADAVLEFAPQVVYPYHYRNQDDTKSDVEAFRQMVTAENEDIEVRLGNWYGE
ncbi:L-ascorbate metabolism protein UlaG (beta-lactamase superfamily) [Neolewinella xylanilytica]|uniref:L-ascorbate metabolism protein UlaG (Beta-lactamase superfamily) n=1 Tax=Neolewinella xylanilytica TaxID=1514080 RepID=A0A2S6I643_9BACT|nr:MBL fold metallo-hydrolase [Neolewinella xylanilytica]PPK86626.1 L-ascorbate metabolism protein UlaG (beta-lactamase superfamily) [Neolewinella xylanilytica]